MWAALRHAQYVALLPLTVRVVGPDDLDGEDAAWIAESYAHGAAGG